MPAQDGEGDDSAGKLALARTLSGNTEDGGMTRLLSAVLEEKMRRRFSPVHLAARLAQVDEVIERVATARAPVQAALDALQARLAGRLWLPPELAEAWLSAHRHTLAVLDALRARLQHTRAGFAALPADEQVPAITPPAPAFQ